MSTGRINAISGKEHDLKIRPHRQDYVVIPEQRWLDGINSGSGTVSQFVAMPLGQGYTIEAQMTDEEKHGGFQLAIFDSRTGRFPEIDPEVMKAAKIARTDRARAAAQAEIMRILPEQSRKVVRALQTMHYREAARSLGISNAEILEFIRGVEVLLQPHGLKGFIPDDNVRDEVVASRGPSFMPDTSDAGVPLFAKRAEMSRGPSFMPDTSVRLGLPPEHAMEMGIAAGGTIKQQIIEDSYGIESWDEAALRDVGIHIVNSEAFRWITGKDAPPSPISVEQYRQNQIPWFSDYEEKARTVAPAGIFKRILLMLNRKSPGSAGETLRV